MNKNIHKFIALLVVFLLNISAFGDYFLMPEYEKAKEIVRKFKVDGKKQKTITLTYFIVYGLETHIIGRKDNEASNIQYSVWQEEKSNLGLSTLEMEGHEESLPSWAIQQEAPPLPGNPLPEAYKHFTK